MNIVVTGASKGIGYETVKAFSKKSSNNIIALSRNKALLDNLRNECITLNSSANVLPLSFDLEKGDINSMLKSKISEHFSTIDILINNAGYLVHKPFDNLIEEDFDKLFNINVKSVFVLVQTLLPLLKENSHIINISSMGAVQGSAKFPGLSLYSASKGALSILTECMAEEFKSKSIKVNCLALGAVQTEMLAEAFPGYQAPIKPDSMAQFIEDFATNGGKYFNGKILPVSISTP